MYRALLWAGFGVLLVFLGFLLLKSGLVVYSSLSLIGTPILPNNLVPLERCLPVRGNITCIYRTCCQDFVSFLEPKRGVLSRECPLREGPMWSVQDS